MHAEPTTFGTKLALFCLQADRDRTRLKRAREAIAVGKLSGAVGTYSNIDPFVESYVCEALGLKAVPATQVIARDRHGDYLYACAAVGTTIESIATEFRHLQRTEVAEVEEPFKPAQKGSSAMPHKRNPITAERLCGLARVLRGYLIAGLEDVALWHERDISHSSVERIVLPDASLVAYYCARTMTRAYRRPSRRSMRACVENLLEGSHGLVFSQPVLLALIGTGLTREAAYRIVQRDARLSHDERRSFRDVLGEDPEVSGAFGGSGSVGEAAGRGVRSDALACKCRSAPLAALDDICRVGSRRDCANTLTGTILSRTGDSSGFPPFGKPRPSLRPLARWRSRCLCVSHSRLLRL